MKHTEKIRASGSVNPFIPPRQMSAHAASVITLLLCSQRKRRQPQVAAEIGVWQGETSRWLVTALPWLTLHMVDPFMAPPPDSSWAQFGDSMSSHPQESFDQNHALCLGVAADFAPRVRVHKLPSVEAAKVIEDGSLNLAFIDGAHDYLNVKADISAWWPKIKSGGTISGHDWKDGGKYQGVCNAVREFFTPMNLTPRILPGKVWVIDKPN